MITPQFLGEIINRHALAHGLRPDIVAAVIIQESNGNPFAIRYEEGFYSRYLANKKPEDLNGLVPRGDFATELRSRAYSWGAMQVMGDTARWCAGVTQPYLSALCDPDVGIEAGCKVLAYYLKKESGDYFRALTRFNAGDPESTKGKQYARTVLARIDKKEHLRFFVG